MNKQIEAIIKLCDEQGIRTGNTERCGYEIHRDSEFIDVTSNIPTFERAGDYSGYELVYQGDEEGLISVTKKSFIIGGGHDLDYIDITQGHIAEYNSLISEIYISLIKRRNIKKD